MLTAEWPSPLRNAVPPRTDAADRTVLLVVRYGFVARNVFRTGLVDRLLESGARVVVVAAAAHERYFAHEIARPNLLLEPLPAVRMSAAERIFESVSDALLFDHPGVTKTITIKWRRLLLDRKLGSFAGKAFAALLQLHRSRMLRQQAERFDRSHFSHPTIGALLDRHAPDLVVTTDLFSSECHFVREAARRHIPTACIVKSWDNLTTKSRIRVHPDRIIVWNDIQREEATRLHFFPADRIDLVGALNFDIFRQIDFPTVERKEFLRRLGAAADAKLIVYSPGAKLTYSDDDNIARLGRVLSEQISGHRCHLHIRKYPKSSQEFTHLLRPAVTVEDAGTVVPAWADGVDQSREQVEHLGNLMYHCDVLVHIGSTIAVDAACFDTPIVGYFLDNCQTLGTRNDYPPHVFELTHNKYLVDLGCQRLARTEGELRNVLQAYLDRPDTDAAGRRRVVEQICGRFDGLTYTRVADVLLDQLGARRTMRSPVAVS
jgi:hypothetical protein